MAYINIPVELVRSNYPEVPPDLEGSLYVVFESDEPQTITSQLLGTIDCIYIKVPMEIIRNKHPNIDPVFERECYVKIASGDPKIITSDLLTKFIVRLTPEVRAKLQSNIEGLEAMQLELRELRATATTTLYRELYRPRYDDDGNLLPIPDINIDYQPPIVETGWSQLWRSMAAYVCL
jgi:hypothetical protein